MLVVQKKEVGPTKVAKFSHIYFDFDHAIINIFFKPSCKFEFGSNSYLNAGSEDTA